MNVKKLLVAALVVGVVLNVYDYVVHVVLLQGTYESLPDLFRQDSPVTWLVIGDFIAALVLVWFYDRVRGSFGAGVRGGATFGLYAGVLLGFPAQLFANMMFVGFPYSLGWYWVIGIIGWGILGGATAGAVYGSGAGAAPAVEAAWEAEPAPVVEPAPEVERGPEFESGSETESGPEF
jgi:hypothetical protein